MTVTGPTSRGAGPDSIDPDIRNTSPAALIDGSD
jgi:hypothetical protein